MVIKHSGQRVGVLIDVQNLYHSAKNLHRSRVNFKEILKTAIGKRSLIRAFGYVVKTKTGEEKPFFEALTNLGIETRVRDLQEFYGGAKKADWDVGIVIDAIRIAPSVDVLVLASGDGDFIALVEYLKNQGKRVEVMAFSRSSSSLLRETADEFIDLSEKKERFLLSK
ncbi:MAG: NYN domain-containing protein [Candidatus Pacebacteria bacterium]|nr:NYN domain-containing protein [Candidatus Paceibacterota bacterium]MDD3072733.1 NYN domain-containing protein [Candidatus Paceibacterota bacterium]MDD3729359.1 NYN domain-containing protein [Candidatus Paceibacterota bacterium]MDD4201668.1 NYN domain-containing protein [Candidatus Paceibacterota bacterium]MDD4467458.1 NYN domain-containing protein [Candidatus Paceibacterota bacterium]